MSNNHMLMNDEEQVDNILNGLDQDWEVVQKEEEGGKHDCTNYYYLLKHKPTQQLYGFSDNRSYNWGSNNIYPVKFWKAKITGTKTLYLYKEDVV